MKDETSKKVFLQYCLLFTIAASPLWQNNLRPMFMGHATAYYKEDAMVSKEKFMTDFEKVIFKLMQQSDFNNHDVLPLLLLGSQEGSSNSKEMAG